MAKMDLECFDFDHAFSAFLKRWLNTHQAEYKGNMDRVEERIPDIYEEFLNTPVKDGSDVTPLTYFAGYDDAELLVRWLTAYHEKGIPIPDILMERIVELGKDAEPVLFRTVRREDCPEELRMTAASLLQELDSTLPMEYYAEMVSKAEEENGLVELYAESLSHMGAKAVRAVRSRYDEATETGKIALLDVLCSTGSGAGSDTYELIMKLLESGSQRTGLLVSYLAKLDDERALPFLYRLCEKTDIDYLDYIEVVNAIEALGGERPKEREFAGDPAYESLRHL